MTTCAFCGMPSDEMDESVEEHARDCIPLDDRTGKVR